MTTASGDCDFIVDEVIMKKSGIKPTWGFSIVDEDKGDFRCARLSVPSLIRNERECIYYGNEILTKRKFIIIVFDYPLSGIFPMIFKSKNGFTRADFYECVYKGYQKIYRSDRAKNKYGLWGHGLGDLVLSCAVEVSPGRYELGIDS